MRRNFGHLLKLRDAHQVLCSPIRISGGCFALIPAVSHSSRTPDKQFHSGLGRGRSGTHHFTSDRSRRIFNSAAPSPAHLSALANMQSVAKPKLKWWQQAVVYQVYPASFKDSNGDGLGDLQGVIEKVPYIASLGVDAVWLSPCFKSPQEDMGYDISDYCDVHPPYGTIADVEKLIAELKKHNIKLLLDLVVNHTSREHPWFLESASSKDNPKRDWYIWREGKKDPKTGADLPPNNWESIFQGSAWTFDKTTSEYYFHIFDVSQPCLNWENPAVRHAVYADMKFWLDKGIGGWRIDAINLISKPSDFPDAPVEKPGYHQFCTQLIYDRPKVHEWLQEMHREVIDKYDDLVTVGECGGTFVVEEALKYVHPRRKEFDMIFQFEHCSLGVGKEEDCYLAPWKLEDLKRIIERDQNEFRGVGAWNTFHLENHDSGRSINVFGRTKNTALYDDVAKMLSLFMCTLGGTLYLHQGQEIGMRNLTDDVPIGEYKDIASQRLYTRLKEIGFKDDKVMEHLQTRARDHARLPVHWSADAATSGGWTKAGVSPWMTAGTHFETANVESNEKDKDSVLNTWRKCIQFRKENPVLASGRFETVDPQNEQVFAYRRVVDNDADILVALNWSEKQAKFNKEVFTKGGLRQIFSVGKSRDSEAEVVLEAYAGMCWYET